MRQFLLFASLCGFYALLSGQFHNTFLMVVGGVACLGITLISGRLGTADEEGLPIEYWLRTAGYVPWLIWQILLANIDVAKRVWSPNLPIAPRMIRIKHSLKTAYGISTYANSITLTPGTVTAEIGDDEFVVHALTKEAADDLLQNDMHERVAKLEKV